MRTLHFVQQKFIRAHESEFLKLFDTGYQDVRFMWHKIPIIRHVDALLQDMYDHNFTEISWGMTPELLNLIKTIKKERGENFIKITSMKHEPLLIEDGFEEERNVTLYADAHKIDCPPAKIKPLFINIRNVKEAISDVISLEIKYYGNLYGEDFCRRRWERYYDKVMEADNGLDIWLAYYEGKLIGFCYSYDTYALGMDSLLVDEEYRHQGVATNLIKHIASSYNTDIVYLHADPDDHPINIYKKMGFEEIDEVYEYLKLDKKED